MENIFFADIAIIACGTMYMELNRFEEGRKIVFRFIYGFFLISLLVSSSWASDHSDYVSGSYSDARSVTEDCLSCHQDQGVDFMKTAHWLWKGPTPFVVGHEKDTGIGKESLMNNF